MRPTPSSFARYPALEKTRGSPPPLWMTPKLVFCFSRDQIQHVRNEMNHSEQRFGGAARITGQVQDHRFVADAADGAAQRGAWVLQGAGGADPFDDSRDFFLNDGTRGFGGDVALGDAGAAGAHDKARLLRELFQSG